ncbi:MAG: alcohol dehydrogenase catalytic domain-containing protein [Anaerolineae bacterium]|nr:alcohol dehydrogenase catalytic domain-containing protein [Anaerolineae bacterium]
MKAVLFHGRLSLVNDYPVPVPAEGEVRVRVLLAGICETDLAVVRGYAGFHGVPGHEFVGVVDRADDPQLVGRRIVGDINLTCGECPACLAGRLTHCLQRTTLGIRHHDGVLAEYVALPVRNLHFVPDGVPDEDAVFAEPMAAACRILEQVHIQPTDRLIVLGDGKIGLLIAQVLAVTGCHVTVVGRHAAHLELLASRGIETALEGQFPAEANAPAEAGVLAGADIVVDCTGQPEGFQTAYQLVRAGGTLVLKSTYPGPFPIDLVHTVVDEVRIIGSRCGPMEPALRLLERRLIDVKSLVEAIYPLDEALAAYEHAARRGTLKILVRP